MPFTHARCLPWASTCALLWSWSLPAVAQNFWSLRGTGQTFAGSSETQFPQVPVYYCSDGANGLLNLGVPKFSDEFVKVNLQAALNEWFRAGANIRPFLAGIDNAACANGIASPGTILIENGGTDTAGKKGPLETIVTLTADPQNPNQLSSATVKLYSKYGTNCPGRFCLVLPYSYNGTAVGGAGADLWSVALTGIGEAIGFPTSADQNSVLSTAGLATIRRRHLLVDDYQLVLGRYPPGPGSPVANCGGPDDANTCTEYRFAFHDTAVSVNGAQVLVLQPGAIEPYGATEVSADQPAACYSAAPPATGAYPFFVALSGLNPASGSFDGTRVTTYTTDGAGNGKLRNSIAVTNSYRAPAVACGTASYLLAWVDQSTHRIAVSWSVDGKTWTASTLPQVLQTFVTPALAFDPSSGRFLLAYADMNANGAVTLAISKDGKGMAFFAPIALVEPGRPGFNPPPPASVTEFIPGIACQPGGLCVVAWGPGSLAGQGFDDPNHLIALADIRVGANGTYLVPDLGWPPVRGWGVSIGASPGWFVVSANDVPGRGNNFVSVTRSGAPDFPNVGFNGSHGASISVAWGDAYQLWYMWGTGAFSYGP